MESTVKRWRDAESGHQFRRPFPATSPASHFVRCWRRKFEFRERAMLTITGNHPAKLIRKGPDVYFKHLSNICTAQCVCHCLPVLHRRQTDGAIRRETPRTRRNVQTSYLRSKTSQGRHRPRMACSCVRSRGSSSAPGRRIGYTANRILIRSFRSPLSIAASYQKGHDTSMSCPSIFFQQSLRLL